MQNAPRDLTSKTKRSNKRRNSRKKSLSPSTGDNESKRSLSEGSAKTRNRKSNIRRAHTHPSAEILLLDLSRKFDKESDEAVGGFRSDNENVNEIAADDRNNTKIDELAICSDKEKNVLSAVNTCEGSFYSIVNSSTVECLNPGVLGGGISPLKMHTDESVSDDSTFVMEITSSDRDTEDERRSHYGPSSLTFDILNDEIQAMFKERFQRLGEELAASTMSHRGFDFVKMFSEQTADPIIKYAREQIAQDFNSCKELESLAMSTLRRVSMRRKRRSPDYGGAGGAGSGGGTASDADRSDLDAGRMQSEDYKLVFISSDSSSREEEGEEAGAGGGPGALGGDGAWDYWEAGGRWRRPRRPRRPAERCARAGRACRSCRACRCGAAPRVLAVPVPVPVPVPAALWPALLAAPPAPAAPAPSARDKPPDAPADARPRSQSPERLVRAPSPATMPSRAVDDSPQRRPDIVSDDVPEPLSSSDESSDRESQHSASFSRVFVVNPSDWGSGEDDADGSAAPSDDEGSASGDCVLLRYSGPDANGDTVEHFNSTAETNEDAAPDDPDAPAEITESSENHKNFIKFCDLNMLHNDFEQVAPLDDDANPCDTELSARDCDSLSDRVEKMEKKAPVMLPLLETGGDLDLVRGIERTLSELLIKETISCDASAPDAVSPESPVSWPRSPRADVARYTSRVMITQENPPPPSVTVQHANAPTDDRDTDKVDFDGGVSVVTNASTLSAVVCLEEGLADDDSWVEEGSRGSPSDLSETDSGDEVEFHRDDEYSACRRSALDFTLHTIMEESCEESEPDRNAVSRPSSATELEKYFFYGLADGRRGTEEEEEDAASETSSARSENADSISGTGDADQTESADPEGLASSRLERYFLTGFMGFSQERRDSDGSGSVGSDSEGRRSPARRKRFVRELPAVRLEERVSSSDEGGKDDISFILETSPNTGSLDAQHRKKQTKKRRNSPADERRYSLEAREDHMEEVRSVSDQDDGRQTPRPEFLPVNTELANCKKQTSRDSGFVGSCDDLLKSSDSHDSHASKSQDLKLDLEEIAEENRQDCEEKHELTAANNCASNSLIRKDSFNNWSSDEETNLMMSKMRQFFKSMVAASANAQHSAKHDGESKMRKPAQLAHFESELTRLMKTVPGIRDEEVREIVEYLSSEDAWSDSYDSSDYTGSDMESAASGRSALRKQISDSCREIIDEFDRGGAVEPPRGDADCVYRKLVASLGDSSPPLAAKVIQHIGSRLVALMHEVSAGSAEEADDGEVEDAPRRLGLGRSRSHDVLGGGSSAPRTAPDIIDERDASDGERFSWRGSFESALLAEPSPGTLAASLAAAGSGERLERVRSLGALTAGGSAGAAVGVGASAAAGSLPRLAVKSARHRAAAAAAAAAGGGGAQLARGRAASAPGLAVVLHGQRRRRTAHAPPTAISATASADDICSSDLYSGINSPGTLRSSSPIPSGHSLNNSGSQDHEDDIGRLVAMHNRSGLQARCESLASVYSGAGEGVRGTVVVRGAVQFALLYNYRLGSLDVVVKRCQDLAPVDTKRNKSDPYVKVYLLPDKSKGGKRKTRVRKGTLQPVWDETLRFSAPLAALASRTLWLSVWHADLLGRNDFLGEVRLPLGNRTFDDTQPQWYTLQERTELFDDNQGTKGDLIVALKFELPDHVNVNNLRAKGTLHVLVKEAKNLCANKSNGLADAFCKSYLLPERSRAAKQKTVVVRRSLNPKWEHCFSYGGISASELRTRALELSVWDRDRFSSNDFMGGIRFSLGTGIYGGSAVDWMDSIGKEVTLWETMLQRHNFWVEGSLPLRPSLSS